MWAKLYLSTAPLFSMLFESQYTTSRESVATQTWLKIRLDLDAILFLIETIQSYRILALLWNLGHFPQPFYIFTESFIRFCWNHKKGRLFTEQKTCLASPQILFPYKNWTIFCRWLFGNPDSLRMHLGFTCVTQQWLIYTVDSIWLQKQWFSWTLLIFGEKKTIER